MEEKEKKNQKKVSKEEADKMQDFAQGLDDEITHTVDYGDLDNEDEK